MEYAAVQNREGLYGRLGVNSWPDYWKEVTSLRTAPNGVFSFKMFIANLLSIAASHKDLYDAMSWTHVIYLTRDDLIGQAISHSRAVRSEAWFSGVEPKEIKYNPKHILRCLAYVENQRGFWEDFFRTTHTHPLRLTYERFTADVQGTMKKIADYLQVDLSGSESLAIPSISIQRDSMTDEWREKFLGEDIYLRYLDAQRAA